MLVDMLLDAVVKSSALLLYYSNSVNDSRTSQSAEIYRSYKKLHFFLLLSTQLSHFAALSVALKGQILTVTGHPEGFTVEPVETTVLCTPDHLIKWHAQCLHLHNRDNFIETAFLSIDLLQASPYLRK